MQGSRNRIRPSLLNGANWVQRVYESGSWVAYKAVEQGPASISEVLLVEQKVSIRLEKMCSPGDGFSSTWSGVSTHLLSGIFHSYVPHLISSLCLHTLMFPLSSQKGNIKYSLMQSEFSRSTML
jgi:hypothetical protein